MIWLLYAVCFSLINSFWPYVTHIFPAMQAEGLVSLFLCRPKSRWMQFRHCLGCLTILYLLSEDDSSPLLCMTETHKKGL